MADFYLRYPLNVPGRYYIDDQCTDCDLCRETAPNNVKRDDRTGISYVYKQPENEEEVRLLEEGGVGGCPTEAVGNDGDHYDWDSEPIFDWNKAYQKHGIDFGPLPQRESEQKMPVPVCRTYLEVAPFLMARFMIFAFSGFCLWWISPYISGEREPIDASFPLLSTWLFISGVLGGIWRVRNYPSASIITAWFGTTLGQVLAIRVLPGIDKSWWLLGLVVAFFTGFLVVLGDMLGSTQSEHFRRLA